jgi:hypothetical protein
MGQGVNVYRSSNGLPGPAYWQNRADYAIHATLDEKGPGLTGSEEVSYTNNSPDTLDVLWLQLDQNLYKADSRGTFAGGRGRPTSTDGYVIESVEVEVKGAWVPVTSLVSDTRLRVDLPSALAPKGGKVKLRITYHFTIPGKWGGRMAGARRRTGRSMIWPSGIRAWPSMTMFAAGTRCPIWRRSFTSNMAISTIG